MRQKGFAPIIILLLLIGLGFLAYFGVFYKPSSQPTPQPETSSTPTTSAPVTPDSKANWKTFTTKNGKFSIKYPPDWTLTDNSKDVDLYQDGNIQFQEDVTISKGNYKFQSRNPLAWGPGVCVFPDTQAPEGEGPWTTYSDYTEIKGATAILRRIKSQPPTEVKNNYITWGICSKDEKSGSFISVAGFGITSYQTPLNYDEATLKTMDEIMASLKPL